ncbi:sugar-binding protein [Puniceicoccus vermicola]|uniref:Carbohydrate-binding domain-containing protein n=1 Tax=Puniceicoccus vermicola TaxID=388746 RepID=A0A7X1AZY1_9BACT|nr:sugar-binding protein [Puniceicoccus vermicola]MBC2602904.1 hypothetical protein [Puniceicoccus vermicola]
MKTCKCIWPLALVSLSLFSEVSGADRLVIEDFEDVGTWRARPLEGMPPEAWFSGNTYLAASREQVSSGDYSGELRYWFAGDEGPYLMSLEREKASRKSAFIDEIGFQANTMGQSLGLAFQIEDSRGNFFYTKEIGLDSADWQEYSLPLNGDTVPDFKSLRFPAVVRKLMLSKESPGRGVIYIDDLAITGRLSRANRLEIRPVLRPLASEPGEPIRLDYRILNASSSEQTGELKLAFGEVRGGASNQLETSFTVAPHDETVASFVLPSMPLGAYRGHLLAKTGKLETRYLDFFAVFEPNGGRINREPMWFAVQDFSSWQGPAENALHIEWMQELGIDLVRLMAIGDWLEVREGEISAQDYKRMMDDLGEAGLDVFLLYADAVPGWTQDQFVWRQPPDDYEAFGEHARRLGTYFSQVPNLKYFEFWNEPDLEFFHGDLEDYQKMLSTFYRNFKDTAPDIPVISGGLTVIHPAEKEGFSEGVIKSTSSYDIAGFHNHGSVYDYATRNELVEAWLDEVGENRKIANTEAGSRSQYDLQGALAQAVTLVQKITYAKSRESSEFYAWFTLQDYWDMDRKADDSLGLVTSDNRPKPSFVAYNELIRRLANTTPEGQIDLGPNVTAYVFRKTEDGRYVYVAWPMIGRGSARFWVGAEGDYQRVDMFGASETLATSEGAQMVSLKNEPIYLVAIDTDDPLVPSTNDDALLVVPEYVVGRGDLSIPVEISNRWEESIECRIEVFSPEGELIQERVEQISSVMGREVEVPLGEDLWKPFGGEVFSVKVTLSGPVEKSVTFPVEIRQPYLINPEGEPLETIRLDQAGDVHDLFYDPFRAQWGGADDLSLEARISHDGDQLLFDIEVTDSEYVEAWDASKLWMADSVQVGIMTEGGDQTELTFGRVDGEAIIWSDIAREDELKGRWPDEEGKISIEQNGDTTRYKVSVSLASLGIDRDAGTQTIRMAMVLNNNNGEGRVRVMKWHDGIAERKDPDAYGHAIIR